MKKKGFTLIELLVVVAIVGVLSSVVLASLSSARSKGRDAKRISEMKSLQNAIELAKASGAQLPQSYNYASSALAGLLVPTYISVFPSDPQISALPPSFLPTYYYCNLNTQTSANYCHNDTDPNTYAIIFYTENRTGACPGIVGGWSTSLCCLTSEGIFPAETGNVSGLHCTQR